jgi:hypothetical protein
MLNCRRAERLDFILDVASTTTLRRYVEALVHSTAARRGAGLEKLRRFKAFRDGVASWSRVERIMARVEATVSSPEKGPLGR